MKLKATLTAKPINATIVISYDGTHTRLMAYEQREQFKVIVTILAKALLANQVPFGNVKFQDVYMTK